MVNIVFIETGAFDLDLIQQLWEKLNDHHRKQKSDFKEHYENFTLTERAEALLKKSLDGDMNWPGGREENRTSSGLLHHNHLP